MLYWLFIEQGFLADVLPGTRVFQYQSFRTAWGMLTSLGLAYVLFPWFIQWMKDRKAAQIIRADGPQSHIEQKVGTPTMGGVCIHVAVSVATLLWARLDSPLVWMVLSVMLGYALIGLYDDYLKVAHKTTDGLAGRLKIVGQLVFGGAPLLYGWWSGAVSPVVALPFFKSAVIDFHELWTGAPDLGLLYVGFALFVVVGTSNAVNLTDGLDGLAIGPVMTSASTYALLAYLVGNLKFSAYLGIPYIEHGGEVAIIGMAIVGAGLGFLWYNAYPAQIFMGDVGSLSLGGTLAMMAVVTKHEVLLVVVGGLFVLETLSVILQVASFKMTGKRIFLMAPIHHHYEKKGWSEPKIIVRFWIISIVLALVALSTLKLR
jgi:phospho-N-acetylmuramoyl-pentapeptide-transferase